MRLTLITIFSFCSALLSQAAEVVSTGMDDTLKAKMDALMRPRLEFILQRPATDWRADDAAFFLQELLGRQGYADSKVDWSLPGNNIIQLKAKLGVKYVLGKIYTSDSAAISEQNLDDYFTQPVILREASSRQNAPYLTDYPEEGAQNVANFLKSQGFWNAKASVAKVTKNKNGKVDIQLKIQRGTLHKITTPSLQGVSPEHQTQLNTLFTPLIGKPATSLNISELNQIVTNFYLENDYQFAEIDTTLKHSNHQTKAHFDVNSDKIYRIRNISVTGNKVTKTRRFNRYTEPIRKKIYNIEEANEVTKKLLLTGAFQIVRLVPKKVNDTELDLVLEVKEARPRFIKAYTGVASFDGFIFGASYTNQNFLRKLQIFNARTEISNRGLLGEISLTEPYFAGKPLSQTTRLYAIRRRFDGYSKNLTGVEASFLWKYKNFYTAKIAGALDYVDLSTTSLTDAELGPSSYANTRISLEQMVDFRDDPILPTKGFHARWLLEQGAINGDASNTYFRTDFNTSYRHAFENKRRLVFSFNAGAIFPDEAEDLPIDLRIFRGGAESVRSFSERELGPQSQSGDPLGGQAYWDASVEFIQPFNDLFSGSIFVDSGDVFNSASDFSFSNPSLAAGLGLRIDLPVGPVRLEYGFNLNRESGEPSGAFHFSIGAQF